MSSRAPDLRSASILLADPEVYNLKLMREMARDCGVRNLYEVTGIAELGPTLATRRPTVAVIDQSFLTASTALDFLCHINGIDDDGTVPLLAVLGHPTRAVVQEARVRGIRTGLCRPFSPRDFWTRLKWVADRASAHAAKSRRA